MRVFIWYWIVCIPLSKSLWVRALAIFWISSSFARISFDNLRFLAYDFLRYGLRHDIFIDWPPYWFDAIWAMIWVITLQATWNDFGLSIIFSLTTVPLSNISFISTRQQLKIGWIR